MAESSLSARPPPLQYEWSQNMTNEQKIDSEYHFRPTLGGKRFTDERIGKPGKALMPANGVGD